MAEGLIFQHHFAGGQIRGARSYQEDDFGFYQPDVGDASPMALLAVLADGMGGAVGGKKASATVVATFLQAFATIPGSIEERLTAALRHANRQLSMETEAQPDLVGMGCTLLAVVLTEEAFFWISVGDSILYLVRDGQLQRLNADHSVRGMVAEALRQGRSPPADWQQAENKNALMSVINGHLPEHVDGPVGPHPLLPGDCLLLASDGLLCLSHGEILHSAQAEQAAHALVEALLTQVGNHNCPGQDNTTVLVLAPTVANKAKIFSLVGRVVAGFAAMSWLDWLRHGVLLAILVAAGVYVWLIFQDWQHPPPVPSSVPVPYLLGK